MKQTRVWIGEVLKEERGKDKHISDLLANKDMNLSDILADDKILLALTKVFQKMLPVEEQKLLEKDYISSSKIAKKYPYYIVERFLRVCSQWKLKDADRFTSSDIVNKVNTRQVCVALRSLASEVRLRHPNFPDFSTQNSTGTIPTDMESSSHSSVPVSHDMRIGSRKVPNHSSVDDMKEMNDPLLNGGSKKCEDADKGEREDLKYENKTLGHQFKPMLKLIAGGISIVAAIGLLMWKMGTKDDEPREEPTNTGAPKRVKQERAGTNKL